MTSEKNRRVRLARLANRRPVEITGAVSGEAEASAPPVFGKVDGVLLALQVKRKEGFNPLRGLVFVVRVRSVDFDLLGEDGFVVVVESNEPLRKQGADSVLDFCVIRMDEASPERIARRLELLGRLTVSQVVAYAAETKNRNEQPERKNQRAKNFEQERL